MNVSFARVWKSFPKSHFQMVPVLGGIDHFPNYITSKLWGDGRKVSNHELATVMNVIFVGAD